jgi:cytochrome b
MADNASPNTEQRYLWDIPTRTFHWLLAALVCTGWILGEFGPFIKTWHFYCGYAIGCLVVLRVLRGLFGGSPNSFWSFIYGPRTTLAYARTLFSRKPSHWPGHNPMGGLSVLALLAVLAVQVTSGLFADDEILNQGPLAHYVSAETRGEFSAIHGINSKIILGLVALHVFIVLFYWVWKHENLIKPMLTGRKMVKTEPPDAA